MAKPGTDDEFDRAVTDFAQRYAEQNERDFGDFTQANRTSQLAAIQGSLKSAQDSGPEWRPAGRVLSRPVSAVCSGPFRVVERRMYCSVSPIRSTFGPTPGNWSSR